MCNLQIAIKVLAINFDFRHFTHFLAILLWIAAGLSFAADMMKPGEGMATLGWAILGVIVINAGVPWMPRMTA